MFRTALTAFAVYGLGFGVGAVLAPDLIYPILGGSFPDEFTRTIARAQGSLAIGFGVLAWLARGVVAADAQRALVIGIVVELVVSGAVVAAGALNGAGNGLVWVIVVWHALLAPFFIFAYLRDRRLPAPQAARA